jgi:S-adenosylmethionine:diacylglycerol 3-amino-3-carboxypropyl transferase
VTETLRLRPLYSVDNEDSRSEQRALAIGCDDTVVAVAAGGGRALALLADGPARLVAVDRRPEQLHTLELKAAALGALDRSDLLAFLGVADGRDRLDQYAALRGSLSPGARRYWDARRALVRCGCLTAGRLDRALVRTSVLLRRLGALRWAAPLFAMEEIGVQRAYLASHARRVARGLRPWRAAFHPWLVYAAAQDPGFFRSTEGSVGAYVIARFERWLGANLARESFLLHLLFHGRLHAAGPLPAFLGTECAARARKHLDRLTLRCADLREIAAGTPAGRVKWSLSDVSCWMSEAAFHDLLRAVTKRGIPGSRLCARHFAAHRRIPPDLEARVRRDADLCRRLEAEDASILYAFDVAEWGTEG